MTKSFGEIAILQCKTCRRCFSYKTFHQTRFSRQALAAQIKANGVLTSQEAWVFDGLPRRFRRFLARDRVKLDPCAGRAVG